jgi:hypothetical protein
VDRIGLKTHKQLVLKNEWDDTTKNLFPDEQGRGFYEIHSLLKWQVAQGNAPVLKREAAQRSFSLIALLLHLEKKTRRIDRKSRMWHRVPL